LKGFFYGFAMFIAASAAVIFATLYLYSEPAARPDKMLFSKDRQWLLSGENRLFEVTERTFDVIGLFGYEEGTQMWPQVGGPKSRCRATIIPANVSHTMSDDEYVIGVVNGAVATAYPLRVLAVHQVVNDSSQDPAVTVYFGNVSRTAAAYNCGPKQAPTSLASTGLLYRNADLLFDVDTESLFLPITGRFVAGARLGESLPLMPSAVMKLGEWRTLFPASRLMTENTGVQGLTYPPFKGFDGPPTLKTALKVEERPAFPADSSAAAVRQGWKSGLLPLGAATPRKAKGAQTPSREMSLAAKGGGPASSEAWLESETSFAGHACLLHVSEDRVSAYVTDETGAIAPSLRTTWKVYKAILRDAQTLSLK